ncbi:PH domain-containing protein [Parasphingorhabdus sp.]|uniref:PH domain-containing protein n=1 Tax=Parasphingorhabdus sp. TaxID=2709688 RepID=UPI002B27ADA5|nr:PH domain-containing protein [Parasphingorhabdus sp.]
MSDVATPATDQDVAPFQHLHPLSIILRSVGTLAQNLFAILVLHFSLFDQNIFYTGLAAMALVALVVGVTALIWSRFTYQVTEREIRIRSGLLNRNSRSIPFDRIQDVSLEQKLVSRLLGLSTVALETGSGGGEDGQLDALARTDAEALRDTIRDYKDGLKPSDAGSENEALTAETPPLFAMDNRRILIAGLFNFSFVLLAILGAIAQNLDFLLPDGFFDPRNWLDALPEQETIDGFSSWARIGGAGAAILSLVAVGLVSGIVRTFVREYGFRLDKVDSGQPGFRRRRGLFTLTDMVMPIHRVQAAILQTGPVRERYGWYHLKFTSLAGDANGETDHSAAPCAMLAEIDPILEDCAIHQPSADLAFQPVHAAFWWRSAILVSLTLTAIALGAGSVLHQGFFAILLLAVPISLIHYLNWRHHQYALSDSQLFVRAGWWWRRLTIVPRRKIQTIDVSQSPLDHPLDLATLTIGIAGGSAIRPVMIKAIGLQQAMDLRRQLLSQNWLPALA